MFHLTHKQLLELKYWCAYDRNVEEALRERYLDIFGLYGMDLTRHDVLEIGTGPLWGLLAKLDGALMYGVDSLYEAYHAMGLLDDKPALIAVNEPFESWETNLQFDLILTTNALDHGEMGFYLITKMWRMLRPGGRLYMHVHLRPPDMLNLLHDHPLTESQLDRHLAYTDLRCMSRRVFEKDIDGNFCAALVGMWERPRNV